MYIHRHDRAPDWHQPHASESFLFVFVLGEEGGGDGGGGGLFLHQHFSIHLYKLVWVPFKRFNFGEGGGLYRKITSFFCLNYYSFLKKGLVSFTGKKMREALVFWNSHCTVHDETIESNRISQKWKLKIMAKLKITSSLYISGHMLLRKNIQQDKKKILLIGKSLGIRR